jgi:glycosyltransferase involved in cell wall biosynthesis
LPLDDRISLIKNHKHEGLTKSLNKALKISKGKYVARMDSDCVSLPKRLEKQYIFLEENPEIFLIGSGAYIVDKNDKIIGKLKLVKNWDRIQKELPNKNCICHSTIMFRKNNILYRDKFFYSQDYDLYLRILTENKKIANLQQPLLYYRKLLHSISQSKRGKQKLFAEKAREFYLERLKNDKDSYDLFLPGEILDIDVQKTTNKVILGSEIWVNFKSNNRKQTSYFCRKYFRNYGYFNKYLFHYFLILFKKYFNF